MEFIFLYFSSLRRADHSSRGVLTTVVRRCVWSTNIVNEDALTQWGGAPHWVRASSFTIFVDHTQRRTTVVRTPLDEWSARRKDPNLTTHKTRKRVRHPCRRGGIRTRNLNGLTATVPRLRSHGHSDVRLAYFYENVDQISADIKRR